MLSVASVCSAQSRVEVSFQSLDPFTSDGVIMPSPQPLTVTGTLVLPSGTGPFPAVVISSSSAGTDDRIMARLLEDLPARGYAALGVQSFKARGLQGGVDSRQQVVSLQGPAVDALYALEFLRSRSEIDPKRICVTGHSRGGETAFSFTYFKAFHELANYKGEGFDCHISISAAGRFRPERMESTRKPALFFFAEKDDAWFYEGTRAWLKELASAGHPVETFTIPNSYHSLTAEPIWCPQAQTGRACKEPTFYSAQGGSVRGKQMTRAEGWRLCGRYGFHCGYGQMELYPVMLGAMLEFLDRAIGTGVRK